MKTSKSIVAGMVTVAGMIILIGMFTGPIKSKADPGRPVPGAVIFGVTEYYTNAPDGNRYPGGYHVWLVSQGKHAPQVSPGDDMAQTIENLLANNFEITQLGGFHFLATRR